MQPHVVHFEIPADIPDRARYFYMKVFGWKSERLERMDYFTLSAKEGDQGMNGAIIKRRFKQQQMVNFIKVEQLDEFLRRVEQFGGMVIVGKQSVPNTGWMAVIKDSEGNAMGLFQEDANAPDNPLAHEDEKKSIF